MGLFTGNQADAELPVNLDLPVGDVTLVLQAKTTLQPLIRGAGKSMSIRTEIVEGDSPYMI